MGTHTHTRLSPPEWRLALGFMCLYLQGLSSLASNEHRVCVCGCVSPAAVIQTSKRLFIRLYDRWEVELWNPMWGKSPGAHWMIKQWLLRICPHSNSHSRLSGVDLTIMKKEGHSMFLEPRPHPRPTLWSSHHLSAPPRPGQTFTCITWFWLRGLISVTRRISGDYRI